MRHEIKKLESPEWLQKNRERVILLIAAIIAGLLRYFSSLDELWLDEVWSLKFTSSMRSIFNILNSHQDNNHILNSAYLYYFGNGLWWPKYRLLSVIAGTAVVPLLGYLGFRKSFRTGIFSLIFATLAFPFITYSSEARGYMTAILFSLTAYVSFFEYNQTKKIHHIIAFWLSSILAILSHLTFLYIFAGFFFLSVFNKLKRDDYANIKNVKEVLLLYSIPSGFMLVLYFIFVKGLEFGGGEFARPGIERLLIFIAPAIGLKASGITNALICIVFSLGLAFWIYKSTKLSSDERFFYLFVLVVMPYLAFFAPVDFFGARYLALSLPFLYLALALLLDELYAHGKYGLVLSVLILSVFIFLNSVKIIDQITIGRGKYIEAVRFVLNNTKGPKVTLITDHSFRNKTMVDFYAKFAQTDKKIEYESIKDVKASKVHPEWFLAHSFDPDFQPLELIDIGSDRNYKLVQTFRHGNTISGWSWFIYKIE